MPRMVNEEEYALKRLEIVNTARGLIYTKGYAQMTVQDILNTLNISKGAFYHYFDSKQGILQALVEQMMIEMEQILSPIIETSDLPAIEKYRQFFATIISWKKNQKPFVVSLVRVWFADDNAIVRQKTNGMMLEKISPLLTAIVKQGVEEGVFQLAHLDHIGEVVMSLLVGLQETISRHILSFTPQDDLEETVNKITATYAVYVDALERTVGAPVNSLFRIDRSTVQLWVTAIREDQI